MYKYTMKIHILPKKLPSDEWFTRHSSAMKQKPHTQFIFPALL